MVKQMKYIVIYSLIILITVSQVSLLEAEDDLTQMQINDALIYDMKENKSIFLKPKEKLILKGILEKIKRRHFEKNKKLIFKAIIYEISCTLYYPKIHCFDVKNIDIRVDFYSSTYIYDKKTRDSLQKLIELIFTNRKKGKMK